MRNTKKAINYAHHFDIVGNFRRAISIKVEIYCQYTSNITYRNMYVMKKR